MQKYIYNSILIVMIATVSCMYANDAAYKNTPIEKLDKQVVGNFEKAEARAKEVCQPNFNVAEIAKVSHAFSQHVQEIEQNMLKFLSIRKGNAQQRKVCFNAFHEHTAKFNQEVAIPLEQLMQKATDNIVRDLLQKNRNIIAHVCAAMLAVITALENHPGGATDLLSLGNLALKVVGHKNLLKADIRRWSPNQWVNAFSEIYRH